MVTITEHGKFLEETPDGPSEKHFERFSIHSLLGPI